jgi:hypothetical protein
MVPFEVFKRAFFGLLCGLYDTQKGSNEQNSKVNQEVAFRNALDLISNEEHKKAINGSYFLNITGKNGQVGIREVDVESLKDLVDKFAKAAFPNFDVDRRFKLVISQIPCGDTIETLNDIFRDENFHVNSGISGSNSTTSESDQSSTTILPIVRKTNYKTSEGEENRLDFRIPKPMIDDQDEFEYRFNLLYKFLQDIGLGDLFDQDTLKKKFQSSSESYEGSSDRNDMLSLRTEESVMSDFNVNPLPNSDEESFTYICAARGPFKATVDKVVRKLLNDLLVLTNSVGNETFSEYLSALLEKLKILKSELECLVKNNNTNNFQTDYEFEYPRPCKSKSEPKSKSKSEPKPKSVIFVRVDRLFIQKLSSLYGHYPGLIKDIQHHLYLAWEELVQFLLNVIEDEGASTFDFPEDEKAFVFDALSDDEKASIFDALSDDENQSSSKRARME